MTASPLSSAVVFHIGAVGITRPVVTTWGIMLAVTLLCAALTRRMQLQPGRPQALLELLVEGITQQLREVLGKDPTPYVSLLGTLFIFLVASNLCDVLPGVEAPTGKPETPFALALIVFFSVHYYGVRARGLKGYLASFVQPKPLMLPLNILSQLTRTFSLMVRLFGNVMSGGFLIALLVALVGLFVPIPLMALEMLIGLVQAYIFAVLSAVFVGAAIGSGEGA